MRSLQRIASLDALRGIAVLLVLLRHNVSPAALPWPLDRLATAGWIGVNLFFVLSGFLIGGMLIREFQQLGRVNILRFIVRRSFRIYPPFLALIVAECLLSSVSGQHYNASQILQEVFFLQNYLPAMHFPHTWSLAVEEHFYVLLALVFSLLPLWKHRRLSPVVWFGPIAFLCLALRIATSLQGPYAGQTHRFATHLQIDSLLFGVFIAYLFEYQTNLFQTLTQKRLTLAAVSFLLISPTLFWPIENILIHTLGVSLLYLGFGCLLIPAIPSRLRLEPLQYIGRHSYSIYLFHLLFGTRVLSLIQNKFSLHLSNREVFFFYFVGSVLFGILMAKLIELPALRLRDRLFESFPDKANSVCRKNLSDNLSNWTPHPQFLETK